MNTFFVENEEIDLLEEKVRNLENNLNQFEKRVTISNCWATCSNTCGDRCGGTCSGGCVGKCGSNCSGGCSAGCGTFV